jgi:hypothetical protein
VAWRSWLWMGIAICVALLVPAASRAKPAHEAVPVDLALLPLQKAQLGGTGSSLALTLNSGTGRYYELGSTSVMGGAPWDDAKLGEGDSYTLDYGRGFTGCGCITEIRTSVERFRSAAIATKRLAYWKLADEHIVRLNDPAGPGSPVDLDLEHVPAVGEALVDHPCPPREAARVVLGVTVASRLAKQLERRLHLALAGRLQARPAKLPPPPGSGPPPGGADPSALLLQQSDLPPAALGPTVGYSWAPFALWRHQAGYRWGAHKALYQSLSQNTEWHATPSEAAFWSAYEEAYEIAGYVGIWPRNRTHVTSVDLDGIRRGERATIIWFRGGSGSFAVVGLSRADVTDVTDVIYVKSNKTQLPASDVEALAQAMAARLDAGVPR